ncbi:hypothetical protein F5J12DRAFT_786320 [Pisolithus orientalis]|uniref:uncharacterized protein n=1 Tax=Pisolithus orientalis TaxID=936130 RepID=UPI00222549F4|nr:uncharacterized protein F5J12DRAFT_786320 [Pisolithus orientalis]KAI5991675.1 hypothetical protein F5J12DRAFT_786320 [Pisolithus orientalis]
MPFATVTATVCILLCCPLIFLYCIFTGGSVTGPSVEMHAEPALEPATFWPMVMDLELPASTDVGVNDELNVAEPKININIVDDIQVEYHPNAGKPTVKVPFTKFTQGHAPKTYKLDPCTALWYLFPTHLDFNLSEFIHDATLNKEQDWTLNNYNDPESTQWAASHCMTAFQTMIMSAPFGGEMMEFKMYCHLLWDWAYDLLKDSSVGPYFVFGAQCLSKFDGASFVHFIDEPWMANKFWDVQSDLPSVVVWIVNLPTWIHNGEGLGGGHVVRWLPIVKEDKRYSGKKSFANFKNHIWHESFKKILDTISEYSKTGYWLIMKSTVIQVMVKRQLKTMEDGHHKHVHTHENESLAPELGGPTASTDPSVDEDLPAPDLGKLAMPTGPSVDEDLPAPELGGPMASTDPSVDEDLPAPDLGKPATPTGPSVDEDLPAPKLGGPTASTDPSVDECRIYQLPG